MPIDSSGTRTAIQALNTDDGQPTGVIRETDFAVCDRYNPTTQLALAVTNVPTGTTVTIEAPAASGTLQTAPVIQYAAPLTETTVAIDAATTHLIVNPAGTIAELTLTLPAGVDGKVITMCFTQIVTLLILNSTGDDVFLPDNISDAAVGTVYTKIYRAADETWYPA